MIIVISPEDIRGGQAEFAWDVVQRWDHKVVKGWRPRSDDDDGDDDDDDGGGNDGDGNDDCKITRCSFSSL